MGNEHWMNETRAATNKKNYPLFFVEAVCARVTRLIEFIIRRIVEPNGMILIIDWRLKWQKWEEDKHQIDSHPYFRYF